MRALISEKSKVWIGGMKKYLAATALIRPANKAGARPPSQPATSTGSRKMSKGAVVARCSSSTLRIRIAAPQAAMPTP